MRQRWSSLLFLLLILAPMRSVAGDFQVLPVRLDLGSASRSGTVSVINSGAGKITLQVQALEWKQDAAGKDVYTETGDIIYFPRLFSIEKGESQMIRVGIKEGVPDIEKTYRLYIQEIQTPDKADQAKGKFQVAILVRFGVPIFVRPAHETLRGLVTDVSGTQGGLRVVVKNTGSVHFRISTVTVTGKSKLGGQGFFHELQGWYLLAGAQREYFVPLAPDGCAALSQVEVQVKGNELSFGDTKPITAVMCGP